MKLWPRSLSARQADLDQEIQSHLQLAIADRVARGQSPAQARTEALREFGNVPLVKDVTTRIWGWTWLYDLRRDLRHSLWQLTRSRAFTLTTLLTLALTIGANTAVFTLVHTILLHQLPFREPDRVLNFKNAWTVGLGYNMVSNDDSAAFRATAQSFHTVEGAAMYATVGVSVVTPSLPSVRLQAAETSAAFFDVLGVSPQLGRTFTPHEDTPGNDHVVLISQRLWQQAFHADPSALGQTLQVNGFHLTILGVLPAQMDFPAHSDLWTPTLFDQHTSLREAGAFFPSVLVRPRPGVPTQAMRSEFEARAKQLVKQGEPPSPDSSPKLIPIAADLTRSIRSSLWLLMGAVTFVLLVACANVASLMLVRTSERRREFAVRSALGASKARLVQQQLVESTLLALCGGTLGILFAQAALRLLYSYRPAALAPFPQPAIELPVLAFTAAATLLTGFAVGIVPAWLAGRQDPAAVLQTGAWRTTSSGNLFRSLLISGEMALAFVLLIGAGLLLRTMANLNRVPLGFDTHGITSFSVALHGPRYQHTDATSPAATRFYSSVLDKLSALPGVTSAGASSNPPLDARGDMLLPVSPSLATRGARAEPIPAAPRVASPKYFSTLGIPIFKGRDFSPTDTAAAPRVVILSRDLADRLWPRQNPLGRQLQCDWFCKDHPTVIGVLLPSRRFGPRSDSIPEYYIPYTQQAPGYMTFVLRSSLDAATLLPSIRQSVAAVDSTQPIYDLETMQQRLHARESLERFELFTLSVFAALAILLVAIGLYGLISYTVARRTWEIGLRLALGARRTTVLLAALKQGALVTLAGCTLGVIGSLSLTRLLSAIVFGVQPHDPLILVTSVGFFMAVAMIAAYLPARRAASIEPIEALRAE
jgi:putative ABC transport system permease protein